MKNSIKYLAILAAFCSAVSCGFGRRGKNAESALRNSLVSELFTIVDTLSGWTLSSPIKGPAICLKIKNNSSSAVTEPLNLTYKFIYEDEIIDSGEQTIDVSAGWNDGFVKRVVIHEKARKLWIVKGLSVEVKYSDGTVAYSGPIEFNDIYPDGDWYTQKHGDDILRKTSGLDNPEPIQISETPVEPDLDPRAAFPGMEGNGM